MVEPYLVRQEEHLQVQPSAFHWHAGLENTIIICFINRNYSRPIDVLPLSRSYKGSSLWLILGSITLPMP